jgi:hypothetical protein
MEHPWKKRTLLDVVPTLDLLNTVTQMPDEGAKLLLVYCCLEHLFVPPKTIHGNRKCIVDGIKASRPDLLKWFEQLYDQRCAYAHKGFIATGEQARHLMVESVRNVLALITARLSTS